MAQENEHKFYVTKEGLDELLKEQDNLIHVVRQQVIVELQEARAQGDLSENADYDAARDHQARVEARILELENMIANAVIIEEDKEAYDVIKKVYPGRDIIAMDASEAFLGGGGFHCLTKHIN